MHLALSLLAATSSALALSTSPAEGCLAAKIARTVDVLPAAWQSAVRDLVAATGTEGQPWSCHGGTVEVALRGDGGILTVTDEAGHAISRDVDAPEEVLPLGEALLAKPLPPAPAPPIANVAPPPRQPDKVEGPKPKPAGAEPKRPILVLNASLAPRYAGRSDIVWGGITAAVAFPFGSWLAGGWFRYDGPEVSVDDHPIRIKESVIGAEVARSFTVSPVEIRASIRPAVAIVEQSFGRDHEDMTRVSPRIGLGGAAVFPVKSPVRAFVGIDTELSPRELAENPYEHQQQQTPSGGAPPPVGEFPTFTMGLGLGVEVAIR
jgi:hypothetical protein